MDEDKGPFGSARFGDGRWAMGEIAFLLGVILPFRGAVKSESIIHIGVEMALAEAAGGSLRVAI